MTIAINSVHFMKSAGNDFFYDYLISIAKLKLQHQFIFIRSSSIDEQLITSKNVKHYTSFPKANNMMMRKFWLDYTLPRIVRRHNADLLIHTSAICSLRTYIAQWIFISDLLFLNFPGFFSKNQQAFFKRNMPGFLNKANKVITISDFLQTQIIQRYSIDPEKISKFYFNASAQYQPVDWNEKEAIKEKYTEGIEYFLFSGALHPENNLVNLLKAFSFFKKRQKSNMQLVITTPAVASNDPFIENLKTYKYRKEVKLLVDIPEKELAKITAGAYAFLYPYLYEGVALFVLQAMQCDVPVITSNRGALSETAGDAALFVNPVDFEDIADKMMLVFKDETRRSELINKGRLMVKKNNEALIDNQAWNSF